MVCAGAFKNLIDRDYALLLSICVVCLFSSSPAFSSFPAHISGVNVNIISQPAFSISASVTLVNGYDAVKAYKLKVFVIREADNAIVGEAEKEVLMAAREVRSVDIKIVDAAVCPKNKYKLLAVMEEATGMQISTWETELPDIPHLPALEKYCTCPLFDTSNPLHILIKIKRPSTSNIESYYFVESYGSRGETIPKGSEYYLVATIKSTDTQTEKKIDYDARIVDTYNEEVIDHKRGEITEGAELRVPFIGNKPGTYNAELSILSPEGFFCGKQVVRAVVGGLSGKITGIENSQDVYKKGENGRIVVHVVGPADGMSVIPEAEVRLKVINYGKVVVTESQKIKDLGMKVRDAVFQFRAPEDLETYTVEVELYGNGELLDKDDVFYRKVVPQIVLTDDGRVRDMTNPCFDDGICEETEIGHGCLDCISAAPQPAEESLKEKSKAKLIIMFFSMCAAIIIAMLLVIIKLRRKV